jgi:hypothetical protein
VRRGGQWPAVARHDESDCAVDRFPSRARGGRGEEDRLSSATLGCSRVEVGVICGRLSLFTVSALAGLGLISRGSGEPGRYSAAMSELYRPWKDVRQLDGSPTLGTRRFTMMIVNHFQVHVPNKSALYNPRGCPSLGWAPPSAGVPWAPTGRRLFAASQRPISPPATGLWHGSTSALPCHSFLGPLVEQEEH